MQQQQAMAAQKEATAATIAANRTPRKRRALLIAQVSKLEASLVLTTRAINMSKDKREAMHVKLEGKLVRLRARLEETMPWQLSITPKPADLAGRSDVSLLVTPRRSSSSSGGGSSSTVVVGM